MFAPAALKFPSSAEPVALPVVPSAFLAAAVAVVDVVSAVDEDP